MSETATSLRRVFEGWEGYNTSLLRAVEEATPEALAYRPRPEARSVGEVVRHLALGRINWLARMDAPGSAELANRIPEWFTDSVGNRYVVEEAIPADRASLIGWLEATWGMIERTLNAWTVDDLFRTYRHTFMGMTYAVSYQWTIWRIMAHDLHHGGQLTILLGAQGIEPFDLTGLGGHLTEPPLADSSP